MGKIYTSVDQLIGGTPLLELTHLERELGLSARILGKLESFNPAGPPRTASPNPCWTTGRPGAF